jgi:ligand-binding sensor domain-containing protein/signal transduction histidine kinase
LNSRYLKPVRHIWFVYVFLTLNFFYPDNSQAQPEIIRFQHLTSVNGLSQNSVNCIFQDYRGFIWLGTDEGLNRYDGYNFKVYKYHPSDSACLSNNKIIKIFEDSHKNLWIGTTEGLNLYRRNRDSFTVYKKNAADSNSLIDNRIRDIFEDSNQRLWIGTQGGLELFDPDVGSFRHFRHDPVDSGTISNNVIFSINEDRQKRLWIGTHHGLNRFVETENQFVRYITGTPGNGRAPNFGIYTIYLDMLGDIWLGTVGGLYRYNMEQDDLELVPMVNSAGIVFPSSTIMSIVADSINNIWMGTTGGLYRFDRQQKKFEHFVHQAENPRSISDNHILSLFVDRIGLLWIGTSQGVNKYDSWTSFFCYYRQAGDSGDGQTDYQVTDLVQDAGGEIWIGTGHGLQRKKNDSADFILYDAYAHNTNSLSADNIYTLYCDKDNNLWIGTSDGLNKYVPQSDRFERYIIGANEPASRRLNFIYSILQGYDGKFWLGTFGGLIKFDPHDNTYQVFQHKDNDPTSISNNAIITVFEDSDSLLWIGTQDGLNYFNSATAEFRSYRNDPARATSISANYITVIREDSTGKLWIGTSGGGLNCLDKKEGNFTRYDEKSGLPNSVIYNILADDSSDFWVTTISGLVRFNPYELNPSFRVFDISDGLPADEFTINSGTKARTGELYLGTRQGFFHFLPQNIKQRRITPPVVLTQFNLFNQPVTVGAVPVWESEQINLTYQDNVFSFEFAALDYAVPHKNILAYKMEGFDHYWTETEGHKNFAAYTNLNPGKYAFKVKGSNSDGFWNEQGTTIKVIITPPFWSTWWFRIICLLFLAAAVLLVFKIRTQSIRQHNRELQQINSRLNNEIKERQHAEAEIQQLNKELEQRVSDRTQRLEEINKELETFTISVSHDLRAPLRSIESFSQILQEDYIKQLDDSGKDYLTRIRSSAVRMSGLINDLLKLSRVARNEICKEDVNLSHIAFSIINDFQKTYPDRKVDTRIEQDLVACCDPQMIRVLMHNLIDNAWKFTSTRPQAFIEFGRLPAANMDAAGTDNVNIYFVRDNGVGFDMKYYEKLFSPFQRLHKVSEYAGAGIGLAIVKRIIGRHNGKVWGESHLDRGSTFYFQILSKKSCV